MGTAWERLGEARLRAVVCDFIERVCNDDMIGFFFAEVDRGRLAEMEFQFAARALGASIPYEGRPLRAAHAAHRIMGGQFERRLTILRQTLDEHGVAADIRDAWLAHSEKLRPLITTQPGSHCDHGQASGPLLSHWRPEPPEADDPPRQ